VTVPEVDMMFAAKYPLGGPHAAHRSLVTMSCADTIALFVDFPDHLYHLTEDEALNNGSRCVFR